MVGVLAVPAHFQSVEHVVRGLAALDRQFRMAQDRRGLFVMAYVAMTGTIAQWIERGRFRNGAAMGRYVVAFANEYRRALEEHVAGRRPGVPVAWQQSFDACKDGRGIFQCLMLGINAHMRRDLPYAVRAAGIDAGCGDFYQDHTRIDEVLRLNIPLVRRRVSDAYGADLSFTQRWFGGVADSGLSRDFARARQRSWEFAQQLALAESEFAGAQVERMIEEHAALAGRKIIGLSCKVA
jgi:hypothetical protein